MLANVLYTLRHATLADLVDILLITIILYNLFLLIRDTRAYQMAIGLGIIGVLYIFAQWGKMAVTQWMIRNFTPYLIIAIVILFQSEIRRFLAGLGSRWFRRPLVREGLDEVFQAVDYLSQKKIGALIAIEKEVSLNTFAERATRIDGALTKELLVSLFFPHSPLHDGAVVVQGNKVMAAGAVLPLASPHALGEAYQARTRHLAALGMSQETDAAVIVVSEETGHVSLAAKGHMQRMADKDELETRLVHYLKK